MHCYVNEVTLGKPLKLAGCQFWLVELTFMIKGSEYSVLSPNLQVRLH